MKWILVIIGLILVVVGIIGLVSTGFLSALWSWILLILGVIVAIVGLVMKGGEGGGETTTPPTA